MDKYLDSISPCNMVGQANNSVGYHAMLLALTQTLEEEKRLKEALFNLGFKVVVTEIGGRSDDDFQSKINKGVIGAALNGEIIVKNSREVHALLHAAEEAKRGILVNAASSTHLALKIAIVRKDGWIAVATFGESSMHMLTGHQRCGMGIMHI